MHTTTIEAQSHSASLAQSTATTGRSSLSGGCHSHEHNAVIFLLSQLVCALCVAVLGHRVQSIIVHAALQARQQNSRDTATTCNSLVTFCSSAAVQTWSSLRQHLMLPLSLRHVECRLEMIIAETSNKEGPHLDVSEQHPEGVYFTSYK